MTIGQNVRRLRKRAGMKTQGELAAKMGVPQPRASDLENDRYEWPNIETLLAAALALGCGFDDLLEGVGGFKRPAIVAQQPGPTPLAAQEFNRHDTDFRTVPLMKGRIAAGPPLKVEDAEFDGALAFSARFLRQWKKPLCVRVGKNEESMLPVITPNDVVLLECTDDTRLHPDQGNIYAVNVDDGATLKRVAQVQQGGRAWLVLISENPDKHRYPARMVAVEKGQTVTDFIIGRVVWRGQYV